MLDITGMAVDQAAIAVSRRARWGVSRFGVLAFATSRWLPVYGTLVAALLIVSRRPDAVLHAQFFAEDGKQNFANVYNHGLLSTLLVPQSGYFAELEVLTAGIAHLFPLTVAPLVMNLIAIIVRVLPVGLLLSDRARPVSESIKVRGLLAALYIVLPGIPEMDATTTNALWYLAVAAVLILICDPPKHRSTRVFDGVVLALCATSGVFAFALAPLAFVYRRWHRRDTLPWWMIAILAAGAALQALSLLVLQYHLPSGFQGGPRGSYPLHPSISLFFEILGRRVILDAFGAGTAAPASTLAVLFGVLGATLALAAFRNGSPALRLFLAFATAMLALGLADPSATWSDLAVPGVGGRYFMIPQLATVAIVVHGLASPRQLVRLPALALVVFTCVFTVPTFWSYPPYARLPFAREAAQFNSAPPGTTMTFPLNPVTNPKTAPVWTMTLTKR